MDKKRLLIIILVLTITTILLLILLSDKKFDNLVVDSTTWNTIINNKKINTNIKIENIKINDYNLIIDEETSIIYYSIVDTKNKYNPNIAYTLNNKNLKIAINEKLKEDKIEQQDNYKILIYDNNYYHIYSLIITNLPILNITYQNNKTNKIPIELTLFDNYIDSPNRLTKSDGKLTIIEENKEYSFFLTKESLGRNKRENNISIFGMEKQDVYYLTKEENINKNNKYVNLFINNKYNGIYKLYFKNERMNKPNEQRQ